MRRLFFTNDRTGAAPMDYGLIAAANQSLNTLKVFAQGFVSIRDESKIQQLRLDMQTAVIQVQSTVMELLQKLSETQEEHRLLMLVKNEAVDRVRELEDQAAAKDSYELHEVRPGAFVLALKGAVDASPKPPYFCQACHTSGVHVALRLSNGANSSYGTWYCPALKEHNITYGTQPPLNIGRY